MTWLEAFVLGLVQGITEFLPVSSSAHLVILQHFFGLKGPMLLLFDVVVHVGTLSAIVVYFLRPPARSEGSKQSRSFAPSDSGKSGVSMTTSRVIIMIFIATIPTAVIGFSLKGWLELFFTSLVPVSIALFANSMILYSTRWLKGDVVCASLNGFKSAALGVVQGVSVIPGISRSGATISSGLWMKLSKEDAFRFSFLIAIPAILGATVVVIPESIAVIQEGELGPLLIGFVTAFISGYGAISILYRTLLKRKFHYFAFYTLCLAVVALGFEWMIK